MISSTYNYITKKYKTGQNSESNEDETGKNIQAMKETFIKSMNSALREINILCDNLFLTQKKYCLEMHEIKSPFPIERPQIQLENKRNSGSLARYRMLAVKLLVDF
ncbi:hypothetical protein MXB_3127 [Myxobolus squamalis]|nr:hypothetical protein MXB_3127 [Myxobolus squamalis]